MSRWIFHSVQFFSISHNCFMLDCSRMASQIIIRSVLKSNGFFGFSWTYSLIFSSISSMVCLKSSVKAIRNLQNPKNRKHPEKWTKLLHPYWNMVTTTVTAYPFGVRQLYGSLKDKRKCHWVHLATGFIRPHRVQFVNLTSQERLTEMRIHLNPWQSNRIESESLMVLWNLELILPPRQSPCDRHIFPTNYWAFDKCRFRSTFRLKTRFIIDILNRSL